MQCTYTYQSSGHYIHATYIEEWLHEEVKQQ